MAQRHLGKKTKKGYVTLISVLILSIVAIIIISSSITVGTDSLVSTSTVTDSKEAYSITDACAERALTTIRENTGYTGTTNLNIGNGVCSFTVTNNGGDGGSGGGPETGECFIVYNVTNQWPNGFIGEVTVQNTSMSAINNWEVKWQFPGTQIITSLWDGTYSQIGNNVTVNNAAYNPTIPANGGMVSFGFQATYNTANYAPVSRTMYLNNMLCEVALINVIEDPGGPPPINYCTVTYNVTSQWAFGFNVDVTINNIGDNPINGWLLEWAFENGENVSFGWDTNISQSGVDVDASNLGYNQTIPVGGSVNFGFQGSKPIFGPVTVFTSDDFTLNGSQCGISPPEGEGGNLLSLDFEEPNGATTFADDSGNGRDFVCIDSNCPTQSANSACGTYSLNFDGAGDQIEDSDAENYLEGLSNFTVSFWVQSDVTNTDRGIFITYLPDSNDNVLGHRYDASGVNGGCVNCQKTGITTNTGAKQIETSNNTQTTAWQHIALVKETATDDYRVYINGAEDIYSDDDSLFGNGITGVTTLLIGQGAKDTAAADGWDGRIDQFDIWDSALSQSEINQLYNDCGLEDPGSGGPASNKLIEIESTVGDTVEKVRIQTSQINPTIEIEYWEEIADF